MKNIDYLTLFFKKHNLSGKINVRYEKSQPDDDYMSDITFENGDVINIRDVIFDIDSELAEDVMEQWLVAHRETGIRFSDWMQTDNHYMPQHVDRSSIEAYQKEMEDIIENVKENINKIFELEVEDDEENSENDEGGSD